MCIRDRCETFEAAVATTTVEIVTETVCVDDLVTAKVCFTSSEELGTDAVIQVRQTLNGIILGDSRALGFTVTPDGAGGFTYCDDIILFRFPEPGDVQLIFSGADLLEADANILFGPFECRILRNFSPNSPINFTVNRCEECEDGQILAEPIAENCYDDYQFDEATCSFINQGSPVNLTPIINCPADLVLAFTGDNAQDAAIATWLTSVNAADECDNPLPVTNDYNIDRFSGCAAFGTQTVTFTSIPDTPCMQTIDNSTGTNNLENYPIRDVGLFSGPEVIVPINILPGASEVCVTTSNRNIISGQTDAFVLTDPTDANSAILWINGIGSTDCFNPIVGQDYYLVVDGFGGGTATLDIAISGASCILTCTAEVEVSPPTCDATEVCDGEGTITIEVFDPASCGCVSQVVAQPTEPVAVNCYDDFVFNEETCEFVNIGTDPFPFDEYSFSFEPSRCNDANENQFITTLCLTLNGELQESVSFFYFAPGEIFTSSSFIQASTGIPDGAGNFTYCQDFTVNFDDGPPYLIEPTAIEGSSFCIFGFDTDPLVIEDIPCCSQPVEPPMVNCYDVFEFDEEACEFVNIGVAPEMPAAVNCYDEFVLDEEACEFVNIGVAPEMPVAVNCYDDFVFNEETCEFVNIGVPDTEPPTFDQEFPDMTISCEEFFANSNATFQLLENAVITDNCDENAFFTFNTESTNSLDCPILTIWTTTLVAQDASNNTTTESFTLTVVDSIPPQLEVPADITISCNDPIPDPPFFSSIASDCSGFTDFGTTETPIGDCAGSFIRTFTVVDACGNTCLLYTSPSPRD